MNDDNKNGKEKKKALQDYCYKIIVIKRRSCATKRHGGKMFVGEERATNTFIRRYIRGRRCSLEGNRYTIP